MFAGKSLNLKIICLAAAGLLFGAGCQARDSAVPPANPAAAVKPVLSEVRQIRLHRDAIVALAEADPDIAALKESYKGERPPLDLVNITYGDITGDQLEEALVPIYSRQELGAAAGVLIYGLKFNEETRVTVERLQKITGPQLAFVVKGGRLQVRQARYLEGDPNCCPSFITYTLYGWDSGRRQFTAVSSTETKTDFFRERFSN